MAIRRMHALDGGGSGAMGDGWPGYRQRADSRLLQQHKTMPSEALQAYPAFTPELRELQQGQGAPLEQSRHHRREIDHWRHKWRRGDVRQYALLVQKWLPVGSD